MRRTMQITHVPARHSIYPTNSDSGAKTILRTEIRVREKHNTNTRSNTYIIRINSRLSQNWNWIVCAAVLDVVCSENHSQPHSQRNHMVRIFGCVFFFCCCSFVACCWKKCQWKARFSQCTHKILCRLSRSGAHILCSFPSVYYAHGHAHASALIIMIFFVIHLLLCCYTLRQLAPAVFVVLMSAIFWYVLNVCLSTGVVSFALISISIHTKSQVLCCHAGYVCVRARVKVQPKGD